MLIFGASVSDWKEKARYAQDKADNDFTKLHEVRCAGIEDVNMAFAAMAAFAAESKCTKFLYHATINLNPGERLTRDQWRGAVDTLEKNLKLTGHDRVVFEHIKKDRQHYHIVWSRLPPGPGKAVRMSNDYAICRKTAEALEKKFGLKLALRKGSNHSRRWESERGRRSGIDPAIVRKNVTAIYRASKTGKEFVAKLGKAGYVLTIGRNGSYVMVDKTGDIHGLMRRIEGAKLADLNRKFPDLKNITLPPLSGVLKQRRPILACSKHRPRRISQTFRRAAFSFGLPPRLLPARIIMPLTGFKRVAFRPRPFLAALIARIRRRIKGHGRIKPNIFYHPMRSRKKHKGDENIPDSEIMPFRRPEWETAELLAWAFENGRADILASFGIHLSLDTPEP